MNEHEVLILDDSADHRDLQAVLLEAAGYRVRTAATAEEARAELSTQHPSVIVMDVGMPEVDGISLTRQLRQDPANDDIAILIYTAYGPGSHRSAAEDAGCDAYLSKPAPVDVLVSEIERCIDLRADR